jgi:hypothetical protein
VEGSYSPKCLIIKRSGGVEPVEAVFNSKPLALQNYGLALLGFHGFHTVKSASNINYLFSGTLLPLGFHRVPLNSCTRTSQK